MANVVVARPEAVGREDLLDVLAQGGALPGQVAAGNGAGGGDQVPLQVDAALALPVERGLQQVAQQRHHPQEDRAVPHRRHPAMADACGRSRRQLDRRLHRPGAAEAIRLQPGQVVPDGDGVAKALAVQAREVSGCSLGQIAFRARRQQALQLRDRAGIAAVQVRVGDQQPDQVQQPLQIQEARVAMALQPAFAIACRPDALVETVQVGPQRRLQLALVGGNDAAECRKSLRPAGSEVGIGQCRGHLLDHRDRHRPLASGVPLEAGGQGGEQPPADPLHRPGQLQGLGEGQPPGPAGVGGVDDHGNALLHRGDQALLQRLLDVPPGALHGGIAEHFGAERIGREDQGRRLPRTAEQGRQRVGEGRLAAGGGADQQVAAQGGHAGGGAGDPDSHER